MSTIILGFMTVFPAKAYFLSFGIESVNPNSNSSNEHISPLQKGILLTIYSIGGKGKRNLDLSQDKSIYKIHLDKKWFERIVGFI